jgi:5-methylcytosine-specific restriction endonuclease McrA
MAKRRRDNDRDRWRERFSIALRPVHKHMTTKAVEKLLIRLTRTTAMMRARSRKCGVPYSLTLEDIREMVEAAYGRPCRYCDRIITIHVMVFDHRVPISKGGASSRENVQIVCKTCNGMKGALSEENFRILLKWLKRLPDDLADDLRRRLCGVRV